MFYNLPSFGAVISTINLQCYSVYQPLFGSTLPPEPNTKTTNLSNMSQNKLTREDNTCIHANIRTYITSARGFDGQSQFPLFCIHPIFFSVTQCLLIVLAAKKLRSPKTSILYNDIHFRYDCFQLISQKSICHTSILISIQYDQSNR